MAVSVYESYQPKMVDQVEEVTWQMRGIEKTQKQTVKKIEQCVICHEPFKQGDNVVAHNQLHPLHRECGQEWIKRNTSCPTCRGQIDENSILPLRDRGIKELKHMALDAIKGLSYSITQLLISRGVLYTNDVLPSSVKDFFRYFSLNIEPNMLNMLGGMATNRPLGFFGPAIGCLTGGLVSNDGSLLASTALSISIVVGDDLLRAGTNKLTEKTLDHWLFSCLRPEIKSAITGFQQGFMQSITAVAGLAIIDYAVGIPTVPNMTLAKGAIVGGAIGTMMTGFISRRLALT